MENVTLCFFNEPATTGIYTYVPPPSHHAALPIYTVPADAQNPQILAGRPQALRVTIGGKEVAPLGPADRTITDVGISAAALNARPAPAAPAGTQQQDGGR